MTSSGWAIVAADHAPGGEEAPGGEDAADCPSCALPPEAGAVAADGGGLATAVPEAVVAALGAPGEDAAGYGGVDAHAAATTANARTTARRGRGRTQTLP